MNAPSDASQSAAPMAGKFCADGPGGRDCHCCGQPPGKWRTLARRAAKRGDKGKWRKSISRYLSR